jgi:ABC-2 type transport system ATP-binding protein
MDNVIEISGLTRRFGTMLALDRVNLSTPRGIVHGIVGINGAGKSTLIKHLLGLLRPQEGTVRLFGKDPIHDLVSVLSRVGYLSEERDLPEWMRVDDLLRYTKAFYPSWDDAYARELLETFDLPPSKRCGELSQGMRAQAALIAAAAHKPDILILDEPSTGLDVIVRRDILAAVVRAVADEERTVLFSSHLLDEVERMSDRVTMIHEGRVVLDGNVEDIRSSFRVSQVRLAKPQASRPAFAAALSLAGHGRFWTVTHAGTVDRVRSELASHGGEVSESRKATLEEVFVAHVGREVHQGNRLA